LCWRTIGTRVVQGNPGTSGLARKLPGTWPFLTAFFPAEVPAEVPSIRF
jgi:hypothetical protein